MLQRYRRMPPLQMRRGDPATARAASPALNGKPSQPLGCTHAAACQPAPRASLSLERFAAALCTLLQQWIRDAARAAGSRRRAAHWRWPCLVLPPACFRPGCYASAGAPQVLSRVAQPPSAARRALDRFYGVTILHSAWPETLKESVQRAQPAAHLVPRRDFLRLVNPC